MQRYCSTNWCTKIFFPEAKLVLTYELLPFKQN